MMMTDRARLAAHIVLFAAQLSVSQLCHANAGAVVATNLLTFIPAEDTNAVLQNPDMGWVLYENYPLDPNPRGSSTLLTLPGETFPDVSEVALMFSWQDVERTADEYDFSRVEHAYDYWKARGKAIQLRVSTESLVWWARATPPAGKGVPAYLLAQLKPEEKQTRRMEGIEYVVVDARNRLYQQRLEKFLHAIDRFASKRPVTLTDLRGFGVWGEWHSGFTYPSLDARREGLKAIIDIWAHALPRHRLALSYSYDPDGPKELYAGPTKAFQEPFTTNYSDFLAYSAFDHALTKANVTWRRDGCGGAVHSNERKLCDAAFALGRGPFMSEFLGGYAQTGKAGTNWVNWMIEDALSLHPNYINLLGWQGGDALRFTRERPDLVAHGLRHMGYRLVPTQITIPSNVVSGQTVTIRSHWVNRGTGRPLRDFALELSITDTTKPRDQDVTLSAEPLPTSTWSKGHAYFAETKFVMPNVAPGHYKLELQVKDPTSDAPIALPLEGRSRSHRYYLGVVEVK